MEPHLTNKLCRSRESPQMLVTRLVAAPKYLCVYFPVVVCVCIYFAVCVFVYVLFLGGNCLLEGGGVVERNFSMGDKSPFFNYSSD